MIAIKKHRCRDNAGDAIIDLCVLYFLGYPSIDTVPRGDTKWLNTVSMGGGNAQKSAMSRQRNNEKKAAEGKGGGGAAGMQARKGGDMKAAMEAAAAERAAVKAKREAKAGGK